MAKLLAPCVLFTIVVMVTQLTSSSTAATVLDHFNSFKSKTSSDAQLTAVQELLKRLFSSRAGEFLLVVDSGYFARKNNMDAFEYVTQSDGKINVKGTSGVALAAGVYHFLKYSCNVHLSWSGDQLDLPKPLPKVAESVRIIYLDRFRYYQNVCTVSYSMAFWDWARWEKEIDWMALNGINLALAFTGQESIWRMVYSELGLNEQEIEEHFAGPAFLAWQRMGNIEGWGGPLPASWFEQQHELQVKILDRMRSFGMTAILPGFAGHVPRGLVTRLYPMANYTEGIVWNGFGGDYKPVLLNPIDPVFRIVGKTFIMMQAKVYGTDHIYNADVFNEMPPPIITPKYMYDTSHAIYESMRAGDPEAVWVLQGWTFIRSYWDEALMEAWFQAVPQGKLIILDLASELYPIYEQTHGYYGHPFIWCMIENFGGNTRLYGSLDAVLKGVYYSRSKYASNMIGTGMTPEGINQNYINFDVMSEVAWRVEPVNPALFAQAYIQRRYGDENLNFNVKYAWSVLMATVYNATPTFHNGGSNQGRVTVTRPYVTDKLPTVLWYNPADVYHAWTHLITGAKSVNMSDTLRHDLVKVGSQFVEDFSVVIYSNLIKSFKNKSISGVLKYSGQLREFLLDSDMLLSTDRYSLLGNWLESAKLYGANEGEKRTLEYNARNQITLWGPVGQLTEYANKNWAGLIKSYYAERWQMFAMELWNCLDKGRDYDEGVFHANLLKFEQAWCNDTTTFTTQPQGDVMLVSEYLHDKYTTLYNEHRDEAEKEWQRMRSETLHDKEDFATLFAKYYGGLR